jgi:hypothetical protein
MRLWKKRVVGRVVVAAVPAQDAEQRFAAGAREQMARERAAFVRVIARIERDAATPALGRGPTRVSRARY